MNKGALKGHVFNANGLRLPLLPYFKY